MLRNLTLAFPLAAGLALWTSAAAQELPVPAPPALPATAYILMDFDSHRVLAEKNADETMPPASITKLMTGYVVYTSLNQGDVALTDRVTVSEKAWRTGGSRMFIEVGTQVTVEDLIHGMVVQSGNDASVALAEHVAGTEGAFVGYMNHLAGRLGLGNTHFTNVTGLNDPGHYSTARDIAHLAQALIRDFPADYARHSVREFSYGGITQPNRNQLLWRDPSVDGIKTGYTREAGYCLVASARREPMRLIAVVLGAESPEARLEQTQALLNYGFRFFETHRLYEAGAVLEQPRVFKGALPQASVGLTEPLVLTIPRGRYGQIEASAELTEPLVAPITQGQSVGRLIVRLDGATLATRPLVALEAVPGGGLFKNLVDSVMLLFH